ncbi:MAG: efflux RND transporter periplasmic adaptor subunit [Nitrospirales bacterium]|nr:efflux RND transporter periplasmic adaptor subunit [Nitrospirales bacterium]
MKYAITIMAVFMLFFAGCSERHEEKEGHNEERISKTLWTPGIELFVEYDDPAAGKAAEFLVHLTRLSDFRPVSEGSLTLTFIPETGEPVVVKIEKPERPGIFHAEVVLKQQGKYRLKASLSGDGLTEEAVLPGIEVHGEVGHEGEHGHEEGERGGDIVFSKEQQWAVEFMTGPPVRQTVSSTLVAPGEIIPVSTAEAVLSAPLAGIISLSQRLPYAGKKVHKGEVLAVIEPPVIQEGGIGQLSAAYAEAKNRLSLALKEHERAKRLYEAKAAPKRRLEEAELGLETAKAVFEPLEKAMQQLGKGSAGNRVVIRAPFSGVVVEVLASNGKAVEPGQALLRIIDTATLWLRANLPATAVGGLKELDRATCTIAGIEGELLPSRLVTVNEMIDPKTRTAAVIYELDNSAGRLRVGMFADVSISTGRVENSLTLPEEALFEDEGRFFIFVQKEGNLFERREVKAGIRGRGSVQILSGIREDERIVLKGGYYVKLAALSSRMPLDDGHGHAH